MTGHFIFTYYLLNARLYYEKVFKKLFSMQISVCTGKMVN